VSPIRFNNPGFQVMEYDKRTGAIKDMATYYLKNLETAKGVRGGKWDLEYDFDTTYGVEGYNVETLRVLTERIDSDGGVRSNFAKYYPVSAKETIKPDDWKKFNDLREISSQRELDALLTQ
jgi:hypothetical protein